MAIFVKMPIQHSPILLETSGTNSFPSPTPESGRLSKQASFYQSKKSAYQKTEPPARFSRRPIPQVVVPYMSHQWHCSEIAEDLDSVPSDDEDDVDYVDETDKDDASESLHSGSDNSSSASERVLKQTSPESSLPHTEAIPVQRVRNLQTGGSYSLKLSETRSPPFFPSIQAESANLHQRKGPRHRYSPEEDKFLVDLKAKNLKWNEIEDLYAKRFSPRKRSLLQGRYYKLK